MVTRHRGGWHDLRVLCDAGRARAEEGAGRAGRGSVNLATESARVHYAAAPQVEARLRRAVRDAGYEPRTPAEADAAAELSPWAGFLPVAVGCCSVRRWCCPCWAIWPAGTGCCRPGPSLRWPRRCSSCWARASTGPAGMRPVPAPATWICWWHWARPPAGRCRSGCGWAAEAGSMPHLYFEGSAVVVTMVLLGKWLEAARQAPDNGRDPCAACACARTWRICWAGG
jgi:Cu+-exporting ATPase